ncbi:hypothetical protein LJ739_06810 [Aestuariibacter halophilus]|uniref:Uncharacterized protein n=1 Tax=Fluctibacter halophilus TaxID=226011 RepID=A0ABS8G5R4_9ALTE|nr:hypothetical protein [Aestuariibacter halophilus]MCC2615947.1 hypothetical protein [Aestuariibacter halophilus]
MESELVTAFVGAGGLGGAYALFNWLLSGVKKDLSDYKLHVAETYVSKGEYEQHVRRIEKSLDEVKAMIQILVEKK